MPRSSCHLLVLATGASVKSGRQKTKRQRRGSSAVCDWFKRTVAPRSAAATETQGRPRPLSSSCPAPRKGTAISPRGSHPLGPARKLQLPAGPAPAARPRPARPGPPPPGLRTGRGGGREGGRGASGWRDPARRVKPRWRLVWTPDAGGRGVSHDWGSPPLLTAFQKASTFRQWTHSSSEICLHCFKKLCASSWKNFLPCQNERHLRR